MDFLASAGEAQRLLRKAGLGQKCRVELWVPCPSDVIAELLFLAGQGTRVFPSGLLVCLEGTVEGWTASAPSSSSKATVDKAAKRRNAAALAAQRDRRPGEDAAGAAACFTSLGV